MNIVELRNKIIQAKLPEWYNSAKVDINYSQIDFKIELVSFSSIYDFLLKQIDGWAKHGSLPNEFVTSKSYFSLMLQEMDRFINETINYETEQTLENQWGSLRNQLNGDNNYFTYEAPKTLFLLKLFQNTPQYFPSAYQYCVGQYRANSKQEFIGTIMAYEFESKGLSEITNRITKEKKTVAQLWNEFQGQLNGSEIQLNEHLSKTSQQYADHVISLDNLTAEKEKLFDDWFIQSNLAFSNFDNDSKSKILDLENTYQEKLRLEKPAEYWRKRAEELKKEGWKAVYWLIGLVGISVLSLYFLLWLTPEGMLLSFLKGNAQAIKWSIIYVTFISFLAFGIRALNKIAFSSFHLARDSEEREQLTYFYLSLKADSSVDEKDRSLILQSLFSRSETGLLKDESGPTMPNDFASKLINK